jgi:two-component system, NarL family, response regulator NreC
MNNTIKIYIADDHQIIIDGIKQFIASCSDMQFVGSNTNGDDALNDILGLKPDIALLDLKMPGKDGLILTGSIKRALPCKVIILSMYAEARYINDAKRFGASAYMLKNANRDELIAAIRQVHHENDVVFTSREKDIIKLLMQGHQTSEISEILHLSPLTVSTHRKNIMSKTNASNVAGLIYFINDHQISLD